MKNSEADSINCWLFYEIYNNVIRLKFYWNFSSTDIFISDKLKIKSLMLIWFLNLVDFL